MTRKTLVLLLAALACAVIAAPARADVVNINTIDTAWVNPVGGANIVINNVPGHADDPLGDSATPAATRAATTGLRLQHPSAPRTIPSHWGRSRT